MSKNVIVIIIIVLVVAILSTGGYFIWKSTQEEEEEFEEEDGGDKGSGGSAPADKLSENQISLKANLGGNSKIVGKDNDIIKATFGGGKYFAQFYSNNRIVLFNASTKNSIRRGSFSNGGKSVRMDNGVVAESGSVWANLANAVK